MIGVGYGNYVAADKIVAIVSSDSSPVKRLVREAKSSGSLIDATAGHKTRSVIVLSNGSVMISANLPETLADRVGYKNEEN